MPLPLTRRHLLAGLSASLALPLAPGLQAGQQAPRGRFRHGVASGDPTAESMVLWTRISGHQKALHCGWQLARDPGFTRVVASGEQLTGPGRDFTVKVKPRELESGETYYYRFTAEGENSPTGRTRTLPSGSVPWLGLAVASCSNYPFGYFNAYESIALDPAVQFVLHLGDYLYEYGRDSYGGATGERLNRQHQPAHETLSLTDYRMRHAQYKADQQSRAMHAAHPLIPIWDDHESANNPWTGGAENHQGESEGEWQARKAAALQAWYEWMPVRDPSPGQDPGAYWRHFRFGDLASLVTLETRHTGRAEQIRYDEGFLRGADTASARRFLRETVGAPGRRLLADEMQTFAATALAASVKAGQPWRLIGNQIPMARTTSPRLSQQDMSRLGQLLDEQSLQRARYYARLGELGLPLYLDPWDGYPRAREAFYDACRQADATDLLVLTGDSHSFWHNRLHDDRGRPMGIELGTSGITSPGDFKDFGPEGAALMDQRLADSNPEVLWTDGLHNGYLRIQLTPGQAHADFVAVSDILQRDYRLSSLRRLAIGRSGNRLQATVR